jgi:hypothetical protein
MSNFAGAEANIIRDLQKSPNDRQLVFSDLNKLESQDHNSKEFQEQLAALNTKLHEMKLLPGLEIVADPLAAGGFTIEPPVQTKPPTDTPSSPQSSQPSGDAGASGGGGGGDGGGADGDGGGATGGDGGGAAGGDSSGSVSDSNSVPLGPVPPYTPLTDASAASQDTLPDHFGSRLLEMLKLPVTAENLRFLSAWQKAEGGSADNPFNTTQNEPGATIFNSDGVKRYPSVDEGLQATAKTLVNGDYQPILDALKKGNNAMAVAEAVSKTPWGTGAGIETVLASQSTSARTAHA